MKHYYVLARVELLILHILKKKNLHDLLLWSLFYQPNLEISSLIKRNNHLNGNKDSQKIVS